MSFDPYVGIADTSEENVRDWARAVRATYHYQVQVYERSVEVKQFTIPVWVAVVSPPKV